MIEFDNVSFAYPSQSPVFTQFDWQVKQGERWAVLGPSGCGKTTLLYLLAGLRLPSSGSIRINADLLVRPRPLTGLILQDYGLLPWATVRQNAELGLTIRNFYGPDGKHAPVNDSAPKKQVIDFWLERLRLLELADKYPAQLSGGQRQRTAIARTLAILPDLLLMDEPFASLDAPTREGLQNLIGELCREQNLTLVVVTHAIEEAAILGENILVLGNPPHSIPRVIANPKARQPDYRDSSVYRQTCLTLRQTLTEQNVNSDETP